MEAIMDPITANIVITVIQVAPKTIEKLIKKNALSEINSKIDNVLAMQDQQILSQLKSAYDAINDAVNATNLETISKRLSYAEDKLLSNTRLDLSLTTADYPNAHWVALANYGLAFVCNLRDDQITQATHIFRMYEADPRFSRAQLSPELYKKFFKPKCKNVFKWKKLKTAEINRSGFTGRVFLQKAGGVAIMASSLVGGVLLSAWNQGAGAVMAKTGAKGGQEIWNKATPEKYRQEALIDLQEQVELTLDECCKKIARKFL